MQNFLNQILRCVRDDQEEPEIFQTVALACMEALQLSGIEIVLYNADHTRVTARYLGRLTGAEDAPRSIRRESFPGELPVRLMEEPQYDPQAPSEIQDIQGLPAAEDARSTPGPMRLTVPIADRGGQLGILQLQRSTETQLTEEEWRWLDQVLDCCAIALRRLQLAQRVCTQSIELRRLNQLQDTFLSTVSYELRIPLSNITMAIQMLTLALAKDLPSKAILSSKAVTAESLVNDWLPSSAHPGSADAPSHVEQLVLSSTEFQKVRRYLEVLQKECDRETKLIQDLLDLQQLDTDTLTLMVSAIAIEQWLPYVVHPFLKRFQEHHLQCDLEIEPNLPSLMCDQISLSRLVVELLTNAWRYTPAGERIRITAGQVQDPSEEPRFRLQIYNSGVEIPIEEIPRIFDKFYRVPKLDLRKHGGTGLGLALVQRLVQRLGGQVWVKSDKTGTCFTIDLPFQGVKT